MYDTLTVVSQRPLKIESGVLLPLLIPTLRAESIEDPFHLIGGSGTK